MKKKRKQIKKKRKKKNSNSSTLTTGANVSNVFSEVGAKTKAKRNISGIIRYICNKKSYISQNCLKLGKENKSKTNQSFGNLYIKN